jgi:thiol-disulfide isomerase/thioredoxin
MLQHPETVETSMTEQSRQRRAHAGSIAGVAGSGARGAPLLARGALLLARGAPLLALGAALLLAMPAAAQDVGLDIGAVPDNVQVQDLDGNAVALSQFIGRKPVLIQFWATWCPLCSELEPRIEAARQQHGDALEVLVIAVGVNQTPRSIRRHIERHAAPPGRMLYDPRGAATRAYKAPTTSYVVALDAAGRVVYTGVGADQDIGAAAARAVRRQP